MTEAEWLACDKPIFLWEHAKNVPRWTPRTLRLFVSAFWGWQSQRLKGNYRTVCERNAKAFEKWAETGKLAHRHRSGQSEHIIFFNESAQLAAAATVRGPTRQWGRGWEDALKVMAGFLRDILGNPLRPVAVDASWLTSTVVALAEGIYADRAFDRLPILADALMDAGCDHAEVLEHCRGDGPHVRGCWVVDLLLGKS